MSNIFEIEKCYLIFFEMLRSLQLFRSQKYFSISKIFTCQVYVAPTFLVFYKTSCFFRKSLFFREEHAQHTSGMVYDRDTVGIRSGYGFPKRDTVLCALVIFDQESCLVLCRQPRMHCISFVQTRSTHFFSRKI